MDSKARQNQDNQTVNQAGCFEAGPNNVQDEQNFSKNDQTGEEIPGNEELENLGEENKEVLQQEIEGLNQEIESLKQENEKYLFRLQRLQADFSNFKKRVEKERIMIEDRAIEEFITGLLPVLDNLERALNAADNTSKDGDSKQEEGIVRGVEMVYNQLFKFLQKSGLEKIKSEGEEFDPLYHEAVMRVSVEDKQENEIVEEMQPGYMYKGKVIRPAMVKVAE